MTQWFWDHTERQLAEVLHNWGFRKLHELLFGLHSTRRWWLEAALRASTIITYPWSCCSALATLLANALTPWKTVYESVRVSWV